MRYNFASDNAAAIGPEAWAALQDANHGFAPSYGDDAWTQRAADAIRAIFETDCDVFFVFNGTAANALSLAAVCRSYHSVICHEQAHIQTDECGAPEFFGGGAKLELVRGAAGKIAPAEVERVIADRRQIHAPKPGALSITQATEFGTVYRPNEIAALAEICRRHQLALHMDGARFANATASLGLPPRALTWEAGVDLLSFGGTKNGVGVGEAVVIFHRELAREFDYRTKQAAQLCSKMRFVTAPWHAMLHDGAWLRHAAHANAMAQRLADGFSKLVGVRLLFPVEANGVFVALPTALADALHARGWQFYKFVGEDGYRFMCSWQTTAEMVDELLADARACAQSGRV